MDYDNIFLDQSQILFSILLIYALSSYDYPIPSLLSRTFFVYRTNNACIQITS